MRTVLCLLAALASADAATISCQAWTGKCRVGDVLTETTCDNIPRVQPNREPGVLAEELPVCESGVCCRKPTCAEKVTCPSGYTRKTAQCQPIELRELAKEAASASRTGTVLALLQCTQQGCCESTCGAAVTCPANKDSETHKAKVCVPHDPNQNRGRGADVLMASCVESSCCLDTCASAHPCTGGLNSADLAKTVCVPSKLRAGGRLAEALETPTCSSGVCCRASCKSEGHVCADGKVPGKHEFRACFGKREGKQAAVLADGPPRLPPCSDIICCEVVHKCAADFDCKANAKHKTDMASVTCVGKFCGVSDCCVDVLLTCDKASRCTGNSTLKTTAAAIPCGLSTLTPIADKCTLEKCCNHRRNVVCADNTACRAGGDSGATCLNGECQCTANYLVTPRTAENVVVQACLLNRIWFSLAFPDGDFDKFTEAHQSAIANALAKLLKKLLRIQFSRGSIVVSGEAETLYDSVAQAAISAAVQGAAPQSVLGSKIETSLSKEDLTCTSTDAGALSAVKATFNGKVECVPTLCNVAKGYSAQPVSHRCVLRTVLDGGDDDLSTGAKVGIALGVIAFVAIVVGVVVLVVLQGGKSEAAPAENEPAADEKEMSNQV